MSFFNGNSFITSPILSLPCHKKGMRCLDFGEQRLSGFVCKNESSHERYNLCSSSMDILTVVVYSSIRFMNHSISMKSGSKAWSDNFSEHIFDLSRMCQMTVLNKTKQTGFFKCMLTCISCKWSTLWSACAVKSILLYALQDINDLNDLHLLDGIIVIHQNPPQKHLTLVFMISQYPHSTHWNIQVICIIQQIETHILRIINKRP